jgi:hypothetical protein
MTQRIISSERSELEKRALSTIIRRPRDFRRLARQYCPCCTFEDIRFRYLAAAVLHATQHGEVLGLEALAERLQAGGPITRQAAGELVSAIAMADELPTVDLALELLGMEASQCN